jgi:hypothetical protein
MKHLGSALFGTAALLALSVTSASAAIVCNGDGDCWHAKQKYDYRPEFGLHVYGDDWRWADADGGASMMVVATGIRECGSSSSACSITPRLKQRASASVGALFAKRNLCLSASISAAQVGAQAPCRAGYRNQLRRTEGEYARA